METYKQINTQFKRRIGSMVIPKDIKETLYQLNIQLHNYSKKVNSDIITSKLSFYFKLVNLNSSISNRIINIVEEMFEQYNLCYGRLKYIDAIDDDISKVFNEIHSYDFWVVNFKNVHNPEYINMFIPEIKRHCHDLVKCVFIEINNDLDNESLRCINEERNEYASQKYHIDFVFKTENEKTICDNIKEKFLENGYECSDEGIDISRVDDYVDNEMFIEDYLMKKAISKDANEIDFNDLDGNYAKPKVISLDQMIGLNNVKEKIKKMECFLKFTKEIGKSGDVFLNTIFKGNPGTGKTTVAKNYAMILHKLGFIKTDKLVQIVPTDLIGEYVGETRRVARKVLDDAKGGVLFIDEAYNLSSAKDEGGGCFMREALVELLKYMEDRSNVIIFAGYKNEMEELMNINPGFKSRIGAIIEFSDYTVDELMEIFDLNIKKYEINVSKDAIKKIRDILTKKVKDKNFGNARYVEKMVNNILYEHAYNVYNKKEELLEIKDSDVLEDNNKVNQFGFVKGG